MSARTFAAASFLVLLGAIAACGCPSNSTPVTRDNAAPTKSSTKPASPKSNAAAVPQKPADQPPVAEKAKADPESAPPEKVAASEDKPTQDATPPSQATTPGVRMLLLAPGGPLLVEFAIELDGQPLGVTFDEILQHVQRSADTNDDCQVTWDELTAQRQVRAGFLGNSPLNNERERLEFVRLYDANQNQVVDESEWSRVFRQGSPRGRVFAVENRDDNRDWNRQQSPLLAVLDADGDRSLSAEECHTAPNRLLRLDADDDERIATYEVSSSRVEIPGMAQESQRRSSGPFYAWQISQRTDWDALIRACQLTYALGGPLASGCFPERPGLFASLDRDGNERLSRVEITGLAETAPHVRLEIRWGAAADATNPQACQLTHWSEELGPREHACRVNADGVGLRLRDAAIELFARDLTNDSGRNRAQAILTQYDANKNAYLDGEEILAALQPLGASAADLDADQNDQITADELTMFVRLQSAATAAQVRAVASHPDDAFWVLLDDNGDGQLDGDEIQRAPQRLLAQDRDQSGDVTADEIPETVWIAVTRGEAPAGIVRPAPRIASPDAVVPQWFANMDANGDGVLSRREFLGELSLFDQLDADRDGSLGTRELPADP